MIGPMLVHLLDTIGKIKLNFCKSVSKKLRKKFRKNQKKENINNNNNNKSDKKTQKIIKIQEKKY